MRKLMWFAVGFVCACLLAVYLLPEEWLPWAALVVIAVCGIGAPLIRRFAAPSPQGEGNLRLRRSGSLTLRVRATPTEESTAEAGGSSKAPTPTDEGSAETGGGLGSGRPTAWRVGCAALGLAVGLLWCWGYSAIKLAPARALEGKYDGLSAEVCDYPTETWYGQSVDGWVESGRGKVRVRFYLYGEAAALRPGDRFTGDFTLRRSDRSFDGVTWYGLQAWGVPLTGSGRISAVEDGGEPLRYFPARWSRAIFERLGELIPADAAGLPQAMLTGDRSGLSEAVREDLSTAGASHVIAVSGLHVAMLMGVVFLLLGRGRLRSLIGLAVLVLFVLMTGASPSVVRAALMLGLLLLAPFFREENDPPSSLALAGLLILLSNPWSVANLSFQLSFAAVTGLLLVSKPLLDYSLALPWVKKALGWSGPKSWPRLLRNLLLRALRGLIRFLCASVSATLGALLFSAPIAAATFGSMPVYGVLTNLFVLPLATLCLSGALLVLALGLVSSTLGGWAGRLLAWPVRAILGICRLAARLPGSTLWMDGYGVAFLLFGGLLLGLVLLLREKRYGKPLLALAAALAAAVGLQSAEAASAQFTFAALDVGQGQCVCAVTRDFVAVTDCGGTGGPSVGAAAAEWLRRKGADRIDALILTHYDQDHVGGVGTLLSLVPVETVWLPATDFDQENRAAVEAAALDAGAELRYVTEDRTLAFEGGEIRLFVPVSDRNDNAACVSVLYSVGEYDMLISGDLDIGAEYALLEREALPPVEIYVAGHHGSARSSSEALLETLRPETVFVSVGRNSYGLPSAEALARFEAVGAEIYRTDECGNLEIGR